MTNLYVGQEFSSFSEFEQCLSSFENENFVKFFKRDSRKIEKAIQSCKYRKNIELNPDLIYCEIRYNCVRGGAFRIQGTGKRKTSSCKIACSAHISLRATEDGKSLKVRSFNNTHNHEISKALFDLLPSTRRLKESERDKAREWLRLRANKKLIQQKLQEETGKIVTLKDLSNLAKSVKSSSSTSSQLQQTAKSVKSSSSLSTSSQVQQTAANVTIIENQTSNSVQEKRTMALNIANEIADIASQFNIDDFNNCMHMLKDIKSHLQNGTKFQILADYGIQNKSPGLCNGSQNIPSTSGSFTNQSVPSESPSSKLNDSELNLLNCPSPQAIALESNQMQLNCPSPQAIALESNQMQLNCLSPQVIALESNKMQQIIGKRKILPKVQLLTVIGLPKKIKPDVTVIPWPNKSVQVLQM